MAKPPKNVHPLYQDQDEARKMALMETGYTPDAGERQQVSLADLLNTRQPVLEPDGTPAMPEVGDSSPPLFDAEAEAPEFGQTPPVEEPTPSDVRVQGLGLMPNAAPPSVPKSQSLSQTQNFDELAKLASSPENKNAGWDQVRQMLYHAGTRTPIPSSAFQAVPNEGDAFRRKLALSLAMKRMGLGPTGQPKTVNPLDDPDSPTSTSMVSMARAMGKEVPDGTTGRAVQTYLTQGRLGDALKETGRSNLQKEADRKAKLAQGEVNTNLRAIMLDRSGHKEIASQLNRINKQLDKDSASSALSALQDAEAIAPGVTDISVSDLGKVAGLHLPDNFTALWTGLKDPQTGYKLGDALLRAGKNMVQFKSPNDILVLKNAYARLRAQELHKIYGSALTAGEQNAADGLFYDNIGVNPALALTIFNQYKKRLFQNLYTSQAALTQTPGGAEVLQEFDHNSGGLSYLNPFFNAVRPQDFVEAVPNNYDPMQAVGLNPVEAPVPQAPRVAPSRPSVQAPRQAQPKSHGAVVEEYGGIRKYADGHLERIK